MDLWVRSRDGVLAGELRRNHANVAVSSCRRVSWLCLALSAVCVRFSVAQVKDIEVAPFVGGYAPLGNFAGGGTVLTPEGGFSESVQQRGAPAGGLSVAAWLGEKVAISVGVGYSPSGTATQLNYEGCASGCFAPGESSTEASGHVVATSVRALVFPAPPDVGHVAPYVIGGVGWVTHSGAGFSSTQSSSNARDSDVGATIGAGVRLPVTPLVAPWVELQLLTATEVVGGWGPNALLSVGISAKVGREQ
jgi:opacity protein-like surface antigen